jgi:hypothetical protein
VSQYQIDNWQQVLTVGSKLSFQQVSNVLNSLGAVTSIQATVAAQYTPVTTDQLLNEIPIEGLNFARFQYGTVNAKAGSLQFKARASVAGTYGGAIQNYARTRSYPFTFTLAANTDTLVTIPNIAGDTSGIWIGATNAGAAYIVFGLGVGPSFLQPASAWYAGQADGATGQTNLVSQINGSTLTITDVQFEVGAYCTQYERKLYDQVLRECQRYLPYFPIYADQDTIGLSSYQTTVTCSIVINFPVEARTKITGVTYSTVGVLQVVCQNTIKTVSAINFYGGSKTTVGVQLSTTAVASVGLVGDVRGTSAGYILGTGTQI